MEREPIARYFPGMDLKELFKKIRQIEIRTKGLVEDVFGGEYHSAFKGQGMEFAEVRPYQFGDDIRSIDWNVTARTGEPYIKKFEEEREQTLMLLVDVSGSEDFGTRYKFKREIAAEISAIVAFSAIRNNDKVGLILFSDEVELFVPPKKGRRHVLRMIRDLYAHDRHSRGTDVSVALNRVIHVLKRRSIVILISDFMVDNYERPLRAVASRHDTIAVHIQDPREEELPALGLVDLTDAETGETITFDTRNPAALEAYTRHARTHQTKTTELLRRLRVDRVGISTDEGYVEPLIQFFRRRSKMS
ncbi:MAG: DUF58 domain-containing protein [Rhodothermales bacterium]